MKYDKDYEFLTATGDCKLCLCVGYIINGECQLCSIRRLVDHGFTVDDNEV